MATFSPVVQGLRRSYDAGGAQYLDLDGLELLSGTQTCPDYYDNPTICPAVSSDVHTFSVPLSGFFGLAEYYAVRVQIDGPALDGADCIVQFAPTADGPCRETGAASYDGVVGPGTWVMTDPHAPAGYVTVPATFEADGEGAPSFPHTWWPDDYYMAILVNPAPTLPVPTGFYDNYYTMALFTPAQMPASIDVQITHTNYLQRVVGTLSVLVSAYNAAEEEPAAGRVMYVGAA